MGLIFWWKGLQGGTLGLMLVEKVCAMAFNGRKAAGHA